MRPRTLLLTSGAVVGAAAGVVAARLLARHSRVEEARYEVVAREGPLEIREYAPRLVAETLVEGGFRGSLNEGFRRLAGYIFGGNRRRESISMTAPVEQHAASEKIAMTAPVEQTRREGRWVVSFTMPSKHTRETLPQPLDERVTLRERPRTRVAALSFSGWATEPAVERKRAKLAELLREHRHATAAEPVLAQYDPPWIPPFLRRNEILAELAE